MAIAVFFTLTMYQITMCNIRAATRENPQTAAVPDMSELGKRPGRHFVMTVQKKKKGGGVSLRASVKLEPPLPTENYHLTVQLPLALWSFISSFSSLVHSHCFHRVIFSCSRQLYSEKKLQKPTVHYYSTEKQTDTVVNSC